MFDLSFSPTAPDLLASASDDESVRLWRQCKAAGDSGLEEVASFRDHTDSVLRVSWSPAGRTLASGAGTNVPQDLRTTHLDVPSLRSHHRQEAENVLGSTCNVTPSCRCVCAALLVEAESDVMPHACSSCCCDAQGLQTAQCTCTASPRRSSAASSLRLMLTACARFPS